MAESTTADANGSTADAQSTASKTEGTLKDLSALADLSANSPLQQLPKCWDTHHRGDLAFLKAIGQPLTVDLIQVDYSGPHRRSTR